MRSNIEKLLINTVVFRPLPTLLCLLVMFGAVLASCQSADTNSQANSEDVLAAPGEATAKETAQGEGASTPSNQGSGSNANQNASGGDQAEAAAPTEGQTSSSTNDTDIQNQLRAAFENAEVLGSIGAAESYETANELVTLHRIVPLPESWATLDAFHRDDVSLAHNLEQRWNTKNLVGIETSVCANGDSQLVSGTQSMGEIAKSYAVGFSIDGQSFYADLAAGWAGGFSWPASGQCEHGLIPVPVPQDVFDTFTASSEAPLALASFFKWPDSQGGFQQLIWDTAFENESSQIAESPVSRPELIDNARLGLGELVVGESLSFESGPATNSTVTFWGWSEFPNFGEMVSGARLVGANLEVCTANGSALPQLGVTVDGWNIAPEVQLAGSGAFEPLEVTAEGCSKGWMLFAVPIGAEVQGFWANDTTNGGLIDWSLEGAALPTPR